MAKEMIEGRRKKYPKAVIELVVFNDDAEVTRHNGTTEALCAIVDKIHTSGCTDIYRAVVKAMHLVAKQPSEVNLNHLVLVTDGEDGSATLLVELIPNMKGLGIVLDFIYMAQPGATFNQEGAIQAIKQVCDATGGTCEIVTTKEEFKAKFVLASTRALLPPPRA
jgi:hypothetical protein